MTRFFRLTALAAVAVGALAVTAFSADRRFTRLRVDAGSVSGEIGPALGLTAVAGGSRREVSPQREGRPWAGPPLRVLLPANASAEDAIAAARVCSSRAADCQAVTSGGEAALIRLLGEEAVREGFPRWELTFSPVDPARISTSLRTLRELLPGIEAGVTLGLLSSEKPAWLRQAPALDFVAAALPTPGTCDPRELAGRAEALASELRRAGAAAAVQVHGFGWDRSECGETGAAREAAFTIHALLGAAGAPAAAVFLPPQAGPGGDLAAEAWAQLQRTPRRLKAASSAAQWSIAAGASRDGQLVHVLISRAGRQAAENPSSGYDLLIENLPWGQQDFRVWRYEITSRYPFELAGEGAGRGGRYRLLRRVEQPAVVLLALEPYDRPRYEALPRRRAR